MSPRLKREEMVKVPLYLPLRNLRKGVGLTPGKIAKLPEVIAALERRAGRRLTAPEACRELEACVREDLPGTLMKEREAILNIYAIGHSRPSQMTTRRADYAANVVYQSSDTVEDWENEGFRQLAILLAATSPSDVFQGVRLHHALVESFFTGGTMTHVRYTFKMEAVRQVRQIGFLCTTWEYYLHPRRGENFTISEVHKAHEFGVIIDIDFITPIASGQTVDLVLTPQLSETARDGTLDNQSP